MNQLFQRFAYWTAEIAGTTYTFIISFLLVVGWVILGPFMHYSNTWQLIITSISSVVTFLMVFLIQYAQNKDTKAIHVKLDELIKTNEHASNKIIDIEEESEEFIDTEKKKLKKRK